MITLKTAAQRGLYPVSLAFLFLASAPSAVAQSDSTPAEKAQTDQLNHDVTHANAAVDAQSIEQKAVYTGQQTRYQEQLQLYRADKANYEERSGRYLAARDRYISAYAHYHRAGWPSRYQHRLIVDTSDLLGASVHNANGHSVGHVVEIALNAGQVDALRVTLDRDRGDVWIQSADLRFDASDKIVMTNLTTRDLVEMSAMIF